MKICVVGGGAAGMIAAITAARGGAGTVLVEKNEKLGKKIYITGKGRCNLTNDCNVSEFLQNVVHGEKFLRSAIYSFSPLDAMAFFGELGLPLITERGNRVFPASEKSSDVIKALANEIKRLKIEVRLNCEVKSVEKSSDGFHILTSDGEVISDKVIIATGGVTYPATGSTGDGYGFAKKFGHTIVRPVSALAPVITVEDVSSLEGLSLKNVELTAFSQGKVIASEFGEMLFTNNGISGPIVLSVSSKINRLDGVTLTLDLKPALNEETLDARLLREFNAAKNKDVKSVMHALLPERLILYVLKSAGIEPVKKVNLLTKEDRTRILKTLKSLSFKVKSLGGFETAVVTSGGVDLKGLKPDMESRLTDGLFFAGEVIDCDAMTGGFNLQIAFATGCAAARGALKDAKK